MYQFIHLFSGSTIKCYTGIKMINFPFESNSSDVAEECAPDSNACFTAQLTIKRTFYGIPITVQAIQGSCTILGQILCEHICNGLKSSSPLITSCTVSNIRKMFLLNTHYWRLAMYYKLLIFNPFRGECLSKYSFFGDKIMINCWSISY